MIEGQTLEETKTGYADIAFNRSGQAWAIASNESPSDTYFLSEYYGRWTRVPLPKKEKGRYGPKRISIDDAGNCWTIAAKNNVHFFDQSKGGWIRVLESPGGDKVDLSANAQTPDIAAARTGNGVVTTGASVAEGKGKGYEIRSSLSGVWENLKGWYLDVSPHFVGNHIWAITREGLVRFFDASERRWFAIPLVDPISSKEYLAKSVACSDNATYVLTQNQRRVWVRDSGGNNSMHDARYIAGDFPIRLNTAPQNKGVTTLYGTDGGFSKFFDPTL